MRRGRPTGRRRGPHRRDRVALLSAICVVLALLGLAGLYRTTLSPDTDRPVGGPFVLEDSQGHVRTDRDLRGRFVLMFFGYTRCTDVCPTTLAVVSSVLDRLDPEARRVQPVFVTIDPEHDTSQRLQDYTRRFSPTLLGLTGTESQLDRVERAFHVVVRPDTGDDGDEITHSAALFLLGPDGKLRAAIPADMDGADLEALLRRTLPGTA